LNDRGLPVFHVLLDCGEDELRRRIENDEAERQARDWRLDHLATFRAARPWMAESADLVLDTTNRTVDAAAEAIVEAGQARLASA
jgi:hypothetical protein